MSLKHILLEFRQWFELKMKNRKSRWKFIAGVCAIILVLFAVQTVNGIIMQKQYGDMWDYDSQSKENSFEEKSSDADPAGMGDMYMMMQPTPMMSAVIISGVLAVAMVTSMMLYLRYRRKHMDGVLPLTVLSRRRNDYEEEKN